MERGLLLHLRDLFLELGRGFAFVGSQFEPKTLLKAIARDAGCHRTRAYLYVLGGRLLHDEALANVGGRRVDLVEREGVARGGVALARDNRECPVCPTISKNAPSWRFPESTRDARRWSTVC